MGVLAGYRLVDVCGSQVETYQFLRIYPDAHRPFSPVKLCLADAFNAFDFVHDIARQVITERHFIKRAVLVGGQRHQHQKARRDFLDLQALLNHGLWQA